MFRITFNNELDNKIRQLAKKPRLTDSAQSFWTDLASLVVQISATPVEIGEAKYDHKNVKLRSYQVVRDFISIYYAVSDEFPFVFIENDFMWQPSLSA